MRQLVSPTAGTGSLLLIGVLLVSGCGGDHPGDRIVATGPNVLLVTIDT